VISVVFSLRAFVNAAFSEWATMQALANWKTLRARPASFADD
jgi:hypothetical protein